MEMFASLWDISIDLYANSWVTFVTPWRKSGLGSSLIFTFARVEGERCLLLSHRNHPHQAATMTCAFTFRRSQWLNSTPSRDKLHFFRCKTERYPISQDIGSFLAWTREFDFLHGRGRVCTMRMVGLLRQTEWSGRSRLMWSSWQSRRKLPPPRRRSISTSSPWRMWATQCASVSEDSPLSPLNLTLYIGTGETLTSKVWEIPNFIWDWKTQVLYNYTLRRETVYETPHSLLDNISMGYRQVFLAHLSLSQPMIFFSMYFWPRLLETTFLPGWQSWKWGEKVKQMAAVNERLFQGVRDINLWFLSLVS